MENKKTDVLGGIMISRKTTMALAEAYQTAFVYGVKENDSQRYKLNSDRLYDLLYPNNFSLYFCNLVRDLGNETSPKNRILKDFVTTQPSFLPSI